jgi:hypothetical protein
VLPVPLAVLPIVSEMHFQPWKKLWVADP